MTGWKQPSPEKEMEWLYEDNEEMQADMDELFRALMEIRSMDDQPRAQAVADRVIREVFA